MIEVQLIDHMGTDISVVNAARVSHGSRSTWVTAGSKTDPTGKEQQMVDGRAVVLSSQDKRLIQFLARGMTVNDYKEILDDVQWTGNGLDEHEAILKDFRGTPIHKSPFNHTFMTFHVKAPIYVARQLVKHEYMPWNEISGRYVEFDADFHVPEVLRSKAANKKQGSGMPIGDLGQEISHDILEDAHKAAYEAYKELLAHGVCEEQARGVLPLNTMTEWYWSGTLGAVAKMAQHRLRSDTQKETQEVAVQINQIASELFPVSWSALVHANY